MKIVQVMLTFLSSTVYADTLDSIVFLNQPVFFSGECYKGRNEISGNNILKVNDLLLKSKIKKIIDNKVEFTGTTIKWKNESLSVDILNTELKKNVCRSEVLQKNINIYLIEKDYYIVE